MSKEQRQPLVAGNWKMNGSAELAAEFQRLSMGTDTGKVDVVICPPVPYISLLKETSVMVGAQDVSEHDSGAYTGEISASMLTEIGCKFAIVGHSERREYHGESNELVVSKAKKLLEAGIIPIICVGEPLSIREGGEVEVKHFIGNQLEPVLNNLSAEEIEKTVFAYEPIWAIGTGLTASPEQAQEIHKFIRESIAGLYAEVAQKTRLLYGGSVKPSNADVLFAQEDIDGGLIGGASLNVEDFMSICKSAV